MDRGYNHNVKDLRNVIEKSLVQNYEGGANCKCDLNRTELE